MKGFYYDLFLRQLDPSCHLLRVNLVSYSARNIGHLMRIQFANRLIGLVGRVFANDPGGLGSIPGRVIPKTLKMVLDTSLLNSRQYKVRIKGKVDQT